MVSNECIFLPGQSSSVLHWGVAVGFPVPVVVVFVSDLVDEVVLVLVGGIPQIVSLGSFTHWFVLRLQHVTPSDNWKICLTNCNSQSTFFSQNHRCLPGQSSSVLH